MLVRQHRLGFQLVVPTAGTRSGVGLFLAALKFFYRVMRDEDIHPHDNPLVDHVSLKLPAPTSRPIPACATDA